MQQSRFKLFIFAALAIMLISACHRRPRQIPDTILTGKATIAADEAIQPMVNAELGVFYSIYNYASIDCKFLSEYDAINLLLQEKVRLVIVTRPLNQKETDFLKNKSIIPESIPLAYDAIAVIVNPENKTVRLSTLQIANLLSGVDSDWSQVNPQEKALPVKLIFDAQSSGIIRSLNDSLHLNNKISGSIIFSGSSQQVIESVASDPNAIGFVGFNWLSEQENPKVQEALQKVKLLAVSTVAKADSTNSFIPSTATLFNKQYPLTRKIYALYTDPAASLARGFLSHLTSERGQKIIYRIGLKPENDFQRLVTIKNDL